MLRRLSLTVANFLLLALLVCQINAQGKQSRKPRTAPRQVEFSGLITSRLPQKDLERWKEIEQIVFAEDTRKQPLHPTLRNLWEWVETSGHAVFIEMTRSTSTSTCTAGTFVIERFDPKGEKHVGVIKLNLSNIDLAYVGPESARENGFIPFDKLSKEERYVEVLGHELAHAVHILTNLERAGKVEEMVEKTNEMLLAWRPDQKNGGLSLEMKRRLSGRDELLKVLEKQAEEMEYIVWQELTAGKPIRDKIAAAVATQ